MSRRTLTDADRRKPRRPEKRFSIKTPDKTGGATSVETLAAPVPLGAVLGAVAVIIAAVLAIALLVGGPTSEVHDSWTNVPIFHSPEFFNSAGTDGIAISPEVHDSWANTGS